MASHSVAEAQERFPEPVALTRRGQPAAAPRPRFLRATALIRRMPRGED